MVARCPALVLAQHLTGRRRPARPGHTPNGQVPGTHTVRVEREAGVGKVGAAGPEHLPVEDQEGAMLNPAGAVTRMAWSLEGDARIPIARAFWPPGGNRAETDSGVSVGIFGRQTFILCGLKQVVVCTQQNGLG